MKFDQVFDRTLSIVGQAQNFTQTGTYVTILFSYHIVMSIAARAPLCFQEKISQMES